MKNKLLKLYRYYDYIYSDIGIVKKEYAIIKETPKGYWIKLSIWNDDKKWVSKTALKRFAYPTKKEALISYKFRKLRQVELLTNTLAHAQNCLNRVKHKLNKKCQ